MQLKIGRVYKNGWGYSRTVMGITADNPDWCYTLQGEWYVIGTGRRVRYGQIDEIIRMQEKRELTSRQNLKTATVNFNAMLAQVHEQTKSLKKRIE